MTVDKYFEHLLEQNSIVNAQRQAYDNVRCYILNTLVDIFFLFCKYNQKNWQLPQSGRASQDEMNLTLKLNKSTSENDFKSNLHRLNKYSSILVNNLSALRVKSLNKSPLNLAQMIYKLKTIKNYIEVFVSVTHKPVVVVSHEFALASHVAHLTSFYCKLDYMNKVIDFFEKTSEKNLNLFFLKNYYFNLKRTGVNSMDTGNSIAT